MTTARTFKLSEDINLNVGNKNINIMKGYSRAPDLEAKAKREISKTLMKVKQIYVIRWRAVG